MTPTEILDGLDGLAQSDQGKRTIATVRHYATMTLEALTAEVEYLYEWEMYDVVAAIYAVRRGDASAALVAVRARLKALQTVSA